MFKIVHGEGGSTTIDFDHSQNGRFHGKLGADGREWWQMVDFLG